MSHDVVCVRSDLGLDILVEILLERGLPGVPVVDDDERLLGFVFTADVVRVMSYCEDATPVDGPPRVGKVMRRVTFQLTEHCSVARAAAIMSLLCVQRIPIVSDDGKVVGLVTSLDIARWVAGDEVVKLPRTEVLHA